MMFVKRGDKVGVIGGKEKGKEGRMSKSVGGKEGVVVEGVKMVKKDEKGCKEQGEGGVMDMEGGMDV